MSEASAESDVVKVLLRVPSRLKERLRLAAYQENASRNEVLVRILDRNLPDLPEERAAS